MTRITIIVHDVPPDLQHAATFNRELTADANATPFLVLENLRDTLERLPGIVHPVVTRDRTKGVERVG